MKNMFEIEVADLKELHEFFKNKAESLQSNSRNSYAVINIKSYDSTIIKLAHDFNLLIKAAEESDVTKIDMLPSVAANMYKDIKTLHEQLNYDDPAILKIVNNEKLAKIPKPKVESFDRDFDDRSFYLAPKLRNNPPVEENPDDLDWGFDDDSSKPPL